MVTTADPAPGGLEPTSVDTALTTANRRELSDAARTLVMNEIVAGSSNRQINTLLTRNSLVETPLSSSHLAYYRRMPECRVDTRRLDVEALQVGYRALSRLTIMHSQIVDDCYEIIFPRGKLPAKISSRVIAAMRMLDRSSKYLWSTLWATALPESIRDETRLMQMAERMEMADRLPEASRRLIEVEISQQLNAFLRELLARRRAGVSVTSLEAAAAEAEVRNDVVA